jgi:hypothetical protein
LPGIGFGTALLLASQFKSAKDVVTAAQVNTYFWERVRTSKIRTPKV